MPAAIVEATTSTNTMPESAADATTPTLAACGGSRHAAAEHAASTLASDRPAHAVRTRPVSSSHSASQPLTSSSALDDVARSCSPSRAGRRRTAT